MNRSAERVMAELAIDFAALGRNTDARASAMLLPLEVGTRSDGKQLVLRFLLGPEQATAFELQE